MHELGIAVQVVDVVTERAAGARILRVQLAVGALTAVLPDALEFCFDVVTRGTQAEGASLEIVARPARAECRTCDATVLLDKPFGRCACGSSDLRWLSGEELEIVEMEVI